MHEEELVGKSPRSHGWRSLARRLKICVIEIVRRYHNALPDFVELYGGGTNKPGPIFKKETRFLHDLARLVVPENILEIGVGGAASTVAFAEAIRKNGRGRIISIDIDQALIDRARLVLKYHGLLAFSTIIKGSSSDEQIKRKVLELTKDVDLVFIDGDHSFEVCRRDFEMYKDLVSLGGIIVFHDTGPFPMSQDAFVMRLPLSSREGKPVKTLDGKAIYHRPDVAKAIDWIIDTYPEYSLLSLHTLTEPCCGLALLQKTQTLFQK